MLAGRRRGGGGGEEDEEEESDPGGPQRGRGMRDSPGTRTRLGSLWNVKGYLRRGHGGGSSDGLAFTHAG